MSILHLVSRVASFLRDEEGATMLEYGLMVTFVAISAVAAVTALGSGVSTSLTGATAKL